MPLYSQVTFSHIRYSDALKNGQVQNEIMQEVLKMEKIHQNWESDEVMEKMLSLVKK
jgi:kynurenine 3-monooxygenase